MNSNPIFIGGPDRCGKTTLRAFLVSHPNISIPAVGSNMWTYFYGQFGDLGISKNFNRCLDAMLRYKHVAFLKPDVDRIRREFSDGEATYARLFALFQEHHAEREGKPRWGDQTGLIERYADEIFQAYPGAKIIHMVRDPRDRYEASLALWPEGKGRAGGATARWLYSIGLAKSNLEKYPQNYLTVKFENMVSDPESTLKKICVFIDEAYNPALLSMDGAAKFRAQLGKRDGDSLLSASYIGHYKGSISNEEIAFMQMLSKKSLQLYGYSLEKFGFSIKDFLYFWTNTWPKNIIRMYVWLTRELIQHNFPGKFGRKPGARMIANNSSG